MTIQNHHNDNTLPFEFLYVPQTKALSGVFIFRSEIIFTFLRVKPQKEQNMPKKLFFTEYLTMPYHVRKLFFKKKTRSTVMYTDDTKYQLPVIPLVTVIIFNQS